MFMGIKKEVEFLWPNIVMEALRCLADLKV